MRPPVSIPVSRRFHTSGGDMAISRGQRSDAERQRTFGRVQPMVEVKRGLLARLLGRGL